MSAVSSAADKEPVNCGKPSAFFFRELRRIHPEVDPDTTLVIGDMSVNIA